MKIFLSALECAPAPKQTGENKKEIAHYIVEQVGMMKWNLMSYYYIQKNKYDLACFIRDHSQNILIDSGAHSFQKGTKVDWFEYTKAYAQFIKEFDRPHILGYFEMDVDNVIGYDKVLQLRQILEQVSDKIIPVWHKNRGIEDFKKMCRDYRGKIVAITGFKNEDIQDHQYLMFLKYAKKYDCKVHCLGMTRRKVLDKVPFDYTDSSSWSQEGIYGMIGKKKVSREFSRANRDVIWAENYKIGMKMQDHYQRKWHGKK